MRGIIAAGLLAAAATAAQAGPMGRLEVGKPFPDVTFTALADGKPASLQSYRGQRVVLHVFASW